ncbi:MAG: FAD-dependent oxidoreductase [Candidatus Altiarchaeota archaeon]
MDYEIPLLAAVDRGSGWMSFRFGIPEGYSFKAGQFAMWRLGEGLMKPFTISNSPTEGGFLEFTTKMSGSDYKKRLSALRPGDKVRLSQPLGKFTYLGQKKMAFLAGGVGITPFRSIIRYLSDTGADCDVILVWGVRSMDEAVFRDEFESLQSSVYSPQSTVFSPQSSVLMKTEDRRRKTEDGRPKTEDRGPETADRRPQTGDRGPGTEDFQNGRRLKTVYVPTNPPAGWAGRSGFIDVACIAEEVPDYAGRVFYVCGPPKMVEAMTKVLSELGITGERLVVEQFSGY